MKKILIFIVALGFIFSCNHTPTNQVKSNGNPYEIVVIGNDSMQNSFAWDTLRNIMNQDVEMINQKEPIFDLVTTVPSNFKHLLKRHRNLIIMETGQKYDTASLKVEYDKHSMPQMIVYMTAPNDTSLTNYIWKNKDNIVTLFNREEQKRMVTRMSKYNAPDIVDTIKSMFGYSIQIPHGYTIRNKTDDFLWISYETPATSLGFFFYTYPYGEERKFTQQLSMDMRDSFAAMIPGPSDGSYMKTSYAFPPTAKSVAINGRSWIEQRGFWDVENDFMGGPFVSFSTFDKANSRVIVIDGYLFSPSNNKPMRNLIRQLENVTYSVEIP